jgi:hypothetical protein
MSKSRREQVVGYLPVQLYEELLSMKAKNSRLTLSRLVDEAIEIALPELRKRHPVPPKAGVATGYDEWEW